MSGLEVKEQSFTVAKASSVLVSFGPECLMLHAERFGQHIRDLMSSLKATFGEVRVNEMDIISWRLKKKHPKSTCLTHGQVEKSITFFSSVVL